MRSAHSILPCALSTRRWNLQHRVTAAISACKGPAARLLHMRCVHMVQRQALVGLQQHAVLLAPGSQAHVQRHWQAVVQRQRRGQQQVPARKSGAGGHSAQAEEHGRRMARGAGAGQQARATRLVRRAAIAQPAAQQLR